MNGADTPGVLGIVLDPVPGVLGNTGPLVLDPVPGVLGNTWPHVLDTPERGLGITEPRAMVWSGLGLRLRGGFPSGVRGTIIGE